MKLEIGQVWENDIHPSMTIREIEDDWIEFEYEIGEYRTLPISNFVAWLVETGAKLKEGDMEFKDKLVDDRYSDLRAEEDDLEDQLMDVRDKIRDLIKNNEQE